MRILIDTNVILDALTGRQPHFDDADKIIKLCADKKVQGYLAAHSISNIFYILRKDLPIEDRRIVLLNLCEILEVEGVDSRKVKSALNRGDFKDLEDCIQNECAAAIKADYIVTRNKKDFENSTVLAILPQEFLDMIENR